MAHPLLGIITNISLEHMEYLGPTLEAIAREKAGIIKPGLSVITGERRRALRELFESTTRAQGGRLLVLGRDFRVRSRPGDAFDYYGLRQRMNGLASRLPGRHQVRNAGLALAAVELLQDRGFSVGEDHIREGLDSVFWPGRGELLKGSPPIMLDGAHNPSAARALAELLTGLKYRHLHLILGILADKDVRGVMRPLLPLAQSLYFARPRYFRAADTETMAAEAGGFSGRIYQFPDIPAAIQAARSRTGPDDLVLITGSLYTVGEARGYLTGTSEG